MDGYKHAKEYLDALHGERWKTSYISPDGHKTGAWIRGQLRAREKGTLTPERESMLRDCGLLNNTKFGNSEAPKIAHKDKRVSSTVQPFE